MEILAMIYIVFILPMLAVFLQTLLEGKKDDKANKDKKS